MDNQLLEERIAQWEKMANDDPENAMGWFSLGNAYKEAGRNEEAARSLRKAIELDEALSRAYQLLGQILIKQDAQDEAQAILQKGYTVAAERGDVMPQRAMESLLEKIGAEVPEVETGGGPEIAVGEGEVLDRRTGEPGPRLPEPPMRGPIGQFIYDHYSANTWQEWIAQGTKVINELKLDFSRIDHQNIYEQHMLEWLGFTPVEAEEYAKQKEQQQPAE